MKDLPIEYKKIDTKGRMLPNCNGENVVQRYGETVSSDVFEHNDGVKRIAFTVVKATDDRLWEALVDAASNCEPTTDVTSGGDPTNPVIISSSVEVDVVDGPKVGDNVLWLDSDAQVDTSVDYLLDEVPESGPSHSALVRSGDYVISVSATDASQETIAAYAKAAIN